MEDTYELIRKTKHNPNLYDRLFGPATLERCEEHASANCHSWYDDEEVLLVRTRRQAVKVYKAKVLVEIVEL